MKYYLFLIFRVILCSQMSTSALPTIIAVISMRSVAILWDRTHARVKQDTQEMRGRAMVRLFVLKTDHCFVSFGALLNTSKTCCNR